MPSTWSSFFFSLRQRIDRECHRRGAVYVESGPTAIAANGDTRATDRPSPARRVGQFSSHISVSRLQQLGSSLEPSGYFRDPDRSTEPRHSLSFTLPLPSPTTPAAGARTSTAVREEILASRRRGEAAGGERAGRGLARARICAASHVALRVCCAVCEKRSLLLLAPS